MGTKIALVGKISVKSMLGGKPKAPETDKPEYLVQMVGIATSIKTGTSNFGDWTALLGSFQATNMETGETVRSGMLFMPDVALNLIIPSLNNKDNKGVEFGFNIGVKKDAASSVGYIYVAEPIFDAAENDPLEMITKKLPKLDNVKQIGKDKKAG